MENIKRMVIVLHMTSFLEMLINFGIPTKACLIEGIIRSRYFKLS